MIISIFGRTGTGKTTLSKKIGTKLSVKRGVPFYFWSPYSNDNPSNDFQIKTNSIVCISEFHIFYMLHNRTKLITIITGHRHFGIDFIIDSQRPALVPRLITAVSEHIICFNITEPRDLQYLAYFLPSDKLQNLRNLEKYNYIVVL